MLLGREKGQGKGVEGGEEGGWQSQTDCSERAADCLGLLEMDQGPLFLGLNPGPNQDLRYL